MAERAPFESLPTLPIPGERPDALEFVDRLFGAVGDNERFFAAVGSLSEWFGAPIVALHEYDHRTREGTCRSIRGLDEDSMAAYEEYFAPRNVWMVHGRAMAASSDITVSHLMYPDERLMHSEWYTDWLMPQRVFHCMAPVLRRDAARTVTMPLLRPRAAGNYTVEEQQALRALVPHLDNAFRLHERLVAAEACVQSSHALIDRMPSAVFVLDASGNVEHANAAARELSARGDGLAMAHGRLVISDASSRAAYSRIFAAATTADPGSIGKLDRAFAILRPSAGRPLAAWLTPLRAAVGALGSPGATAALFITDPDADTSCQAPAMRALFGLSPAEAGLACKLVAGTELRDAAGQLGVTVNTARTLLRRIFTKTGANRQSDLVRLLLGSPTTFHRQ
jgi:DNA-binding CsgD family transcriptional regulator